jgi:hypothetical protein
MQECDPLNHDVRWDSCNEWVWSSEDRPEMVTLMTKNTSLHVVIKRVLFHISLSWLLQETETSQEQHSSLGVCLFPPQRRKVTPVPCPCFLRKPVAIIVLMVGTVLVASCLGSESYPCYRYLLCWLSCHGLPVSTGVWHDISCKHTTDVSFQILNSGYSL